MTYEPRTITLAAGTRRAATAGLGLVYWWTNENELWEMEVIEL